MYNTTTTESQNHCRNYLPHIEDKKMQFVTFRLYDSLPQSVIDYYKTTLNQMRADESQNSEKIKECLRLIDRYEDSGYGQCFFRIDRMAELMVSTLQYHNNDLYRLYDWCVMPNHVHVLLRIADGATLSKILHSWRSYTAHKGNELLGRKGPFWMSEYFDRYIRDDDHGLRVSRYITMNPVKAGLVSKPEEWKWSSAWEG